MVQGLDQLLRRLAEMATDTRQVEAPLRAIGAYMLDSIERNFREQRWQALAPSTIRSRLRGKRHKSASGIRILIDTARLKNSIGFKLVGSGANAGVAIGTNVRYARRHQFGYPGGQGRGRARTPARPFLLFQDEDIKEIGEILRRHMRA